MTCQDYRAAYGDVWAMTRGERAVYARHFEECGDCHRWTLDGIAERDARRGADDARAKAAAEAIYQGDMADPEFTEVAFKQEGDGCGDSGKTGKSRFR